MAIGTKRNPAPLVAARSNDQADRVPADYWLNIGFVDVNEETGEEAFISLTGIPNTAIKASTGSSDIAQASSALQKQVDDFAMSMEPGVEILNLQIQIRRVSEAGTLTDSNVYKGVKSLKLVG